MEQKHELAKEGICCLCGGKYTMYGNNPSPLCDEDDDTSQCCDKCNWEKVIPARLLGIKSLEEFKARFIE